MNRPLNHMRRSHAKDPKFRALYGLDGCSRTYKKSISFRNYLIWKHNFKLTEEGRWIQPEEQDNIDQDKPAPEQDQHEDCIFQPEKMKENNAMCLLDFKDKGRVPQTMVNFFT